MCFTCRKEAALRQREVTMQCGALCSRFLFINFSVKFNECLCWICLDANKNFRRLNMQSKWCVRASLFSVTIKMFCKTGLFCDLSSHPISFGLLHACTLIHGSKSWSRPPTRGALRWIGRDVSYRSWTRKTLYKKLKKFWKITTNLKKNAYIIIHVWHVQNILLSTLNIKWKYKYTRRR